MKLVRGNCQGGKSPGGNCPGGNFMGSNCPGDSYPRGNAWILLFKVKVTIKFTVLVEYPYLDHPKWRILTAMSPFCTLKFVIFKKVPFKY